MYARQLGKNCPDAQSLLSPKERQPYNHQLPWSMLLKLYHGFSGGNSTPLLTFSFMAFLMGIHPICCCFFPTRFSQMGAKVLLTLKNTFRAPSDEPLAPQQRQLSTGGKGNN